MNTKHSVTVIATFSAVAAIFVGGCGASPEAQDRAEEGDSETLVASVAEALGPTCSTATLTLEAGPISSNSDANTKCPNRCNPLNMDWNGQWWTTVPNRMSVCECACTP